MYVCLNPPMALCNHNRHTPLAEYAAAIGPRCFVECGTRCFWERAQFGALTLRPEFLLHVPSRERTRSLFRETKAPLLSYVQPPDDDHPQNAWLYVCRDQEYSIERLGSRGRRDARRALRELRFAFIDEGTLLEHGEKAYCDTRTRVGISDGTPRAFVERFTGFAGNPAHQVLAAWKNDRLAAFATVVAVDDWLDIYPYAAADYLSSCPVDGLITVLLGLFLTERKYRLVNYGLSSIQQETGAVGLHRFKKKVGFECLPVHRKFVFHPVVRPFANRLSLQILRVLTHVRPGNLAVRKAAGLIATHLGGAYHPMDVDAVTSPVAKHET